MAIGSGRTGRAVVTAGELLDIVAAIRATEDALRRAEQTLEGLDRELVALQQRRWPR